MNKANSSSNSNNKMKRPKEKKRSHDLLLDLSKSQPLGWGEINNSVRVTAKEVIQIFMLNIENFQKIARFLQIIPKERNERKRWLLNLYDVLRISYFIYFYKNEKLSGQKAAKKADELVEYQKKMHDAFRKYKPMFDIDLKKAKLTNKERAEAMQRFEQTKELIRFYRDPELTMGWGVMLRAVMSFNWNEIEKGARWIIRLEPRMKTDSPPEPEKILKTIQKENN